MSGAHVHAQPTNTERMPPRFFAPEAPSAGVVVKLPPDEGRHLAQVLRLAVGATVRVFDGCGHEHAARVDKIGRGGVFVCTLEAVAAVREPSVRLTLALALLKSHKLDEAVRDGTMLGVSAVQPLVTARTEVAPPKPTRQRPERWFKIAVASAKQCGRAVVPHVHPPTPYGRFIREDQHRVRILLVEPAAGSHRSKLLTFQSLANRPPPDSAVVAVGPEGGWTADELVRAERAGFELLTIGARTLRADTAPIVVLAVLQFLWGDL